MQTCLFLLLRAGSWKSVCSCKPIGSPKQGMAGRLPSAFCCVSNKGQTSAVVIWCAYVLFRCEGGFPIRDSRM